MDSGKVCLGWIDPDSWEEIEYPSPQVYYWEVDGNSLYCSLVGYADNDDDEHQTVEGKGMYASHDLGKSWKKTNNTIATSKMIAYNGKIIIPSYNSLLFLNQLYPE